MHHEPLIHGLTQRGQTPINLATMHNGIVEAIGWGSPQLMASLTLIDPFPDVNAKGRESIEAALKKQPGIQ